VTRWLARLPVSPVLLAAAALAVIAVAALVAVLTDDPAGDDSPLADAPLVADTTPVDQDESAAPPATGDSATDVTPSDADLSDPGPTPTPDAVAEPDSTADAASAADSTPDATADPAALPEPAAADPASADASPDETAPASERVLVSPNVVRQGETVLVRVPSLDAGSILLTVDGRTTSMVREGDGWVGYVPVAPLSDLGAYTVIVDVFDAGDTYQTTHLGQFLVVDAGVPIEEITLLPGDEDLLAPELVAIDNNTRFVEHSGVSGPRLWEGPWQRPLPGDDTGIFGALRSYNGAPASDWHHGHDFDAEAGDPIAAAARGRVVFADELPVHGFGVILDHGAGVYSGYWHMSEIRTEVGAIVDAGTVIGLVGDTGLAVGAHLHWEVIVRGQDVDPIQWLDAPLHE